MADSQGAAKAAPATGIVNWIRNIDIRQVAVALSLLAALAHGVISGELPLAHLVPASWDDPIKAYCGLYLYIFPLLIGAHGYTAAKWTAPAVKALILLAVMFVGLTMIAPAHALTRYCIGSSKLPLGCTPRAAASAPVPSATSTDQLQQIIDAISNLKSEIIEGAIADIQAADVDASTVVTPAIPATPGNPAIAATPTTPAIPAVPPFPGSPAQIRDPIAHACYPAAVQFLQSLPSYSPPTGKFVNVQNFQRARDFVAQIKAGVPVYLQLGCVPLFGDVANTVVQLLATVGVRIAPAALAAIMPATAPVTLPLLTLTP